MDKYCRNCGAKLKENADVCLKCGCIIPKPDIIVNNDNDNDNDNDKREKHANVGLILGLVSIVAWFLPFVGYPVSICGIVFSSKGLKSKMSKSKATAGLILSIIFLVFTFFNSMLGALRFLYYI